MSALLEIELFYGMCGASLEMTNFFKGRMYISPCKACLKREKESVIKEEQKRVIEILFGNQSEGDNKNV